MADWIADNIGDDPHWEMLLGTVLYCAERDPKRHFPAPQWNQAFVMMSMLSAHRVFGDDKYRRAAAAIARQLRSLQIFDPFLPESYGAIREQSAMTASCYVRDALSGAWGYLEYYRATGNVEFLKRAVLWGEWFLKHGMDETGWPWWGVAIDPVQNTEGMELLPMHNELQGAFHGGCLNFFYQLHLTTEDRKWVGGFFERIADHFCARIRQEDGFFRSVERATGKVPPQDPQNGLHRCNDDFGTLGLLCAHRIYPKPEYLHTVDRFIRAATAQQRSDGSFEDSCAAIPVVLNVIHESEELLTPNLPPQLEEKALKALFSRQYPADEVPALAGGLDETGRNFACSRSVAYALLYLLKVYGGDRRFLRGGVPETGAIWM